jgi:cyclohexyl-isocyanide hydratase
MAFEIGMFCFPRLTQLDLTGPHEVLSRIPGARVRLFAKTREPLPTDGGLTIVPNATFDEVERVDLLFVPGGSGQIAVTEDAATLDYLAALGHGATWVTSACTGALLLGAAGLLRGYRAATHWAFMGLLSICGATPVDQRVVVDRNRITGGGVTAGIDIALVIVAQVAGREAAEEIQLGLEYDPHPPFQAGHPRVAPAELVQRVRAHLSKRFDERQAQLEKIVEARGQR